MGNRHQRSSPECDEESEVQWMPHKSVEKWHPEWQISVWLASEVEPGLPQSKQVEVINEEGADEDDSPTYEVHNEENVLKCRVLNFPYNSAEWLPLPHHQHEAEACKQYECAALQSRRNDLCPAALEARPYHDAVL